jgi:hypothetical protein
MKTFTKIAAVVFGIAALIHIYRLFSPFTVVIAGNVIPQGASIVIAVIAFIVCIGLWRESKR